MLQKLILPPGRLDDIGMTMANADRHNPAKSIKISSSVFVEHILSFALHDHQRSFVVQEEPGVQKLPTRAQHFLRGWPTVRLRLIIEWREFRVLHDFVLRALSAPSATQRL